MGLQLGFVGFGEAAYHLTKGLRREGLIPALAYDLHSHTPGRSEKIQSRAADTGTRLVGSPCELAALAEVIISAVPADQAVLASEQIRPYLYSKHLYADLNSVSPKAKEQVAAAATANGSRFVEIAVMGPVPPKLHKVPLLIGGPGAEEFASLFRRFGMQMEVVSTDQVGRAAAIKMFRSVVYKGLEALLFECMLGASQYGAEPRVFASLEASIPGVDWQKLADYMIGRVVIHGERRAREMDEVAKTLEELGVDPWMAAATAKRFDWAASLGLKDRFGGEFPATYGEVMEAIAEVKQASSETDCAPAAYRSSGCGEDPQSTTPNTPTESRC